MNKEEFKKIIRKYSTIDLLKYCAKLSIEMYNNNEPFKVENLPYYYKNGIKAGNTDFIYAQHEIINLIYLSILYGNDYRNKKMNKYEFVNTLDKLKKYKNNLAGKDNNVAERYLEFFSILFNEQIEFQKINLALERFDRLCFIFGFINKKYSNHPEYIDFEHDVKELTGMTIDEYNELNILLTLMIVGSNNPDITEIINKMQLNLEKFFFNKTDLETFIDLNSRDYTFFRNNDKGTENWNNLKYSPLVKTDKDGHIIVSNIYGFLTSFSTRMYWLVRDKYKKMKKQTFTNYFGFCFEMYLKELLDYYNVKSYIKIDEKSTKQPDWLIETKDYNLVIEQKSTLFTIGSRETTLENKYEEINKFIDMIKKAMTQLSNFELDNEKITLRMCVAFEEIESVETIQELAMKNLKVKNKELYWLVNISDFEKLIYIMTNDYDYFKEIIEKKIELEKSKDKEKDGSSFEKILPKENEYINTRLDYFKKNADKIADKLK